MHRPLARLALVGALGALALASAAHASTQTVTDPKGDNKSDLDLRKVVITDENGTITAKITTWKAIPQGVWPCLLVRAGRHTTTQDYWSVGCLPNKKRATAPHSASKPIHYVHTRYSNTFTFQAADLGIGTSFRWRTQQTEEDRVAESVPDHGWALHKMG
jgi:hypothetical protein